MIHKYLRLRKRASKDASGNSTTPRTGSLDLVNRNDRPFVRNADNDEAGLLVENGAAVNSVARVDTITFTADGVVDGETLAYGNEHFQFNASDGTTVSNVGATPVKAQGKITVTALPANGEQLVVGGKTYTFQATNDPGNVDGTDMATGTATTGDIWIAQNLLSSDPGRSAHADETLTAAELILRQVDLITSAINGDDYNAASLVATATSSQSATNEIILTAKYDGSTGDAVVFTTNAHPEVTVDGGGTLGGFRAGVDPQYTPIDITSTSTKSTGTLTLSGVLTAGNEVVLGATTYTAVANNVSPAANQFKVGATAADSISNLIAAIMGTDGVSTANASATVATGAGTTMVATAKIGGVVGDAIVSTDTSSAAAWGAGTLGSAGVTDQTEAAAATATAINGRAAFSAVQDSATVVVTHTLHGTTPNGYGFATAVDAGDDITSAQTTAGVDGTEGIQGAQREHDGFLYTCTGAVPANKDYTWKKTAVQNVTVAGFTTSAADSLAIPITHRFVDKTTGADAEALTLADGTPGQILTVSLVAIGGGSGVGTLTPSRKRGFTAVVLAQVKDTVTLEYVDDTSGWIVIGATGTAAPPVIT